MSLSQPLLKQDPLLRLALEQLADWSVGAETVASISLLPHRGAHRVYRVGITTEKGPRDVAIRMPSRSNHTGKITQLGQPFEREIANHVIASQHQLAPQLFWTDPEHEIAVMDYATAGPAVNLEELAECLVRIHGMTLEGNRLSLATTLDDYRRAASTRGDCKATTLDPELPPLQNAIAALADQPEAGCHHDLNLANLLRQGHRLTVIDWEYAAPGDVYFDTAAASAGNPSIDGTALITAVLGEKTDFRLWQIAALVYRAVEINWLAAMGEAVAPREARMVLTALEAV
jgi:hypothetical protein